jgi:hypothetical protein
MSLTAGARLGPYEIVAPIGAADELKRRTSATR